MPKDKYQIGLKIFGHKSHIATNGKGDIAVKRADKFGYFEWWESKARKILKKQLSQEITSSGRR